MAQKVIMPKQGLQMTEGTILEWLIKEGQEVKAGEPLFEMETDKLTITIDADVSGTLLKIIAGEGAVVPITETIAVVGTPGENISEFLTGESSCQTETKATEEANTEAVPKSVSAESTSAPIVRKEGERILISPRAKKLAEELGLDYSTIAGSGAEGMIIERDVVKAKDTAPKATPLAKKVAEIEGVDLKSVTGTGARGKIRRGDLEASQSKGAAFITSPAERKIVPMRGMRKVIAERMKQSQNENAQTSHTISVRMDEAKRVREALEKAVGFNDIVSFAVVRALTDFPAMNSQIVPEGIWEKEFVNLGIAVAVDDGLIVPVVKDADLMSLREFSAAAKELAGKARDGKLTSDEYSGGTFTVSNLGMFGLDSFVAIINPPEAGILAVGKIEDTPVAVNGAVEIHPVMKLTLSYDHRIVDGAPAAQFLAKIKEYLENPYKLL
ncbi:MAG: 2-oxo acid dehydrogenase subunit E2 [Lachnospiraceae bacterium]|jgi:pyruvate dehydrogenase E2 component (dihydrolipoamide acetyltransferase)|nr:2-oxo acid dehydrogenase subunit E2 [Lachnospiraceae bacterium]